MRPLETLRANIFWIVDAVKGNPIKKQLDDIIDSFENYDTDRVKNKQQKYLNDILNYACSNIEYYKRYKDFDSIKDFPIINKNIIRDNENLFLNPQFDKSKLFKQETSGSTGTPFAVYQDPIKRTRATADTLYFSKLGHYELGTRLYFSRVWDLPTKRSKITCIKQNWIIHDSSNLSDNNIKKLIDKLETDKSTKSVILFASTLSAIANYLVNNNIYTSAKVNSFITISESLDLTTKKIIQDRFKTVVVSRYSDQELGILAQQKNTNDTFIVNNSSFYIELLDLDKDIPAKKGAAGRIVVTDLFNFSMPLIRYDTGDIAVISDNSSGFSRIEGRRVDFIYDTKGNLVSPYVINTPLHEFLEIQQYQFIQNEKNKYKILVNLRNNEPFGKEVEMINVIKSYLGIDAFIEVEYVSEIPVLKSGKRKQVVNNYKR